MSYVGAITTAIAATVAAAKCTTALTITLDCPPSERRVVAPNGTQLTFKQTPPTLPWLKRNFDQRHLPMPLELPALSPALVINRATVSGFESGRAGTPSSLVDLA